MSKLKEIIKDENFIRLTIFVSFNALLLYILFFAVKNIGKAASLLLTALSALLHALTPVIIGIVLAYILAPLVEWVSSYIHFSSFRIRKKSGDCRKKVKSKIKRQVYSNISTGICL